MRELEELLRTLEETESLTDRQVKETSRQKVNAEIRTLLTRNLDAARSFLQKQNICHPASALVAASLVEALAGGQNQEFHLLQWYFDVATLEAAKCPEATSAASVLTSYAFLEHRTDTRKFDMLPRYVALAHSTETHLRHAAVELLAGFEVATAPGVRDELTRMLSDTNWRVRNYAEDLLREEGVLPSGYRPSLLDRLRRRIFSQQTH
jgi:hypothetical protein